MQTIRTFVVGALLGSILLASPAAQTSIVRLTSEGWLVGPGDNTPILLGSNGKGYLKVDGAGAVTLINGATFGGTSATLGGANIFTALNKFTAGLESYENNHADNAEGVILGQSAGGNDESNSVNIGFFAGGGAGGTGGVPTGAGKTNVGRHAGFSATGANSVAIGHAANQYGYNSAHSVAIGYLASRNQGQDADWNSFDSTVVGREAFTLSDDMQTGTGFGAYVGRQCTDAVGATLLGYRAGETGAACRESLYIGQYAGYSMNRSKTFILDTDSTLAVDGTAPFMYGEFDNRVLQFNAATGYRRRMESVTTTKTPALNESGEFYYTGDTDGQAITLLNDPTVLGPYWNFVVTATQASNSMSIAPGAGETLRDGTSSCSTITATAIGARLGVMVTATGSGGHFTVTEKLGTWTCNP